MNLAPRQTENGAFAHDIILSLGGNHNEQQYFASEVFVLL